MICTGTYRYLYLEIDKITVYFYIEYTFYLIFNKNVYNFGISPISSGDSCSHSTSLWYHSLWLSGKVLCHWWRCRTTGGGLSGSAVVTVTTAITTAIASNC
jgi:hypothetical protein